MLRMGLRISLLTAAVVLATNVLAIAKESHHLILRQTMSLAGTSLPPGEYKVTWEAHSPAVTVTFSTDRKKAVSATAEGKIVERSTPYATNSVLCDEGPDGTRVIKELRFAGQKQVIVFGDSASTTDGTGR